MDHKKRYDQMRVGMPRLRTTAQQIKLRRRRKRIDKQSKFHIIIRMAAEAKHGYISPYLTQAFKRKL